MPKLVSELAQGKSFSRSSDGGALADQATRTWKILLNSPNESFVISDAIGVNIGDPLGSANPIPCVSLDVKADGESRMVRIVTAQYRTSAGVGNVDPGRQEPATRPALYSMTTSLTEIAAWGGAPVVGGVSGAWIPAVNPVGDLVDGVTRLEPVVNINIDQYSYSDMSQQLAYCGYVNSDIFTFSNLSVGIHCCMLQSISSQAVVEQFGDTTFRGFKVTFGFAVRAHWTITRDGFEAIGWDIAVPQTGFNIRNTGIGRDDVDQKALALQHTEGGKVMKLAGGQLVLADGTSGTKVRAMVTVPAGEREDSTSYGYTQRPAAQPVALNDDGTPRNADNFSINEKVLISRICIQPEMVFGSNFSAFGVRWFT
jgi:hypothetical protein